MTAIATAQMRPSNDNADDIRATGPKPSAVQKSWLERGLRQPAGKLPLFDQDGQRVDARTVRSCIERGWAEPWFANPIKPDWLVCKLTSDGRAVLSDRKNQSSL